MSCGVSCAAADQVMTAALEGSAAARSGGKAVAAAADRAGETAAQGVEAATADAEAGLPAVAAGVSAAAKAVASEVSGQVEPMLEDVSKSVEKLAGVHWLVGVSCLFRFGTLLLTPWVDPLQKASGHAAFNAGSLLLMAVRRSLVCCRRSHDS